MKQPAKPQSALEADPGAEILDDGNRTFMVMPLASAHRQRLPHKSVVVLVYDGDNRLYLRKRSEKKSRFPGRWDLSVRGHVLPGESAFDAAVREVWETLCLRTDRLKFLSNRPPGPETGFEYMTIFILARPPHPLEPDPGEVEEGYYHTPEEVQYLVREFRELLTPGLVSLWLAGVVFADVETL